MKEVVEIFNKALCGKVITGANLGTNSHNELQSVVLSLDSGDELRFELDFDGVASVYVTYEDGVIDSSSEGC